MTYHLKGYSTGEHSTFQTMSHSHSVQWHHCAWMWYQELVLTEQSIWHSMMKSSWQVPANADTTKVLGHSVRQIYYCRSLQHPSSQILTPPPYLGNMPSVEGDDYGILGAFSVCKMTKKTKQNTSHPILHISRFCSAKCSVRFV